jgi:hypothetical protein|tara:strand:+ start:803 stop:1027 length:225 start_codon:yes stop_codon:yes gene_type:complete
MKIIRIEKTDSTTEENYTKVTFKYWWGKVFTRDCITRRDSITTTYASSGECIPSSLWHTVKAFLRTKTKEQDYE